MEVPRDHTQYCTHLQACYANYFGKYYLMLSEGIKMLFEFIFVYFTISDSLEWYILPYLDYFLNSKYNKILIVLWAFTRCVISLLLIIHSLPKLWESCIAKWLLETEPILKWFWANNSRPKYLIGFLNHSTVHYIDKRSAPECRYAKSNIWCDIYLYIYRAERKLYL